jgi:hypothetical protein
MPAKPMTALCLWFNSEVVAVSFCPVNGEALNKLPCVAV